MDGVQKPGDDRNRNTGKLCSLGKREGLAEQMNQEIVQSFCPAVILRQEGIGFQEAFSTGTGITAFPENQRDQLCLAGNVFDYLVTVVMNSGGFPAAAGAGLFRRFRFDKDFNKRIRVDYFFD